MADAQKRCCRCQVEKPLHEFNRCRSKHDGLQGECRPCQRAKQAAYREANREKLREKNRVYHAENAHVSRAYYLANRERIKAAMNERYAQMTPEERKARGRAAYERDRPGYIARSRARRLADPERAAAEQRAYYEANRERITETTRLYRAANRDRYVEHSRAYRARKRGQFVENIDPLVVLELDDGVCGICGADVDPHDFHIDHVIPISRGGEHGYANVAVAHPVCNLRKWARTPDELPADLMAAA